MKYHITPDGPAVCEAFIKKCLYDQYGEHFDDYQTAEEYYASSMGLFNSLSREDKKTIFYSPDYSSLSIPSVDEIQEVLDRCRKLVADNRQGDVRKFASSVIDHDVVSYSLMGSVVYGLDTPDSDKDYIIYTDGKERNDFHHVFDDGADVHVSSLDTFLNRVMDGQNIDIDVLHSGIMSIVDKRYEPFIHNIRFNTLQYIDTSERQMFEMIKLGLKHYRKDEGLSKRSFKALKTGLRHSFMVNKVVSFGQDYQVKFSSSEREYFYKVLNSLDDDFILGNNIEMIRDKFLLFGADNVKNNL